MPYSTDGLVGKLALQKGIVTAEQLKDCLAEQAASQKAGQKRPLGLIMVARGLMKDDDLLDLLEEQKRVLAERTGFAQVRKEDFLFGQILLKKGIASSEEINQALRVQAEAAERGDLGIPRLGQILIDMGVTEEHQIQETLKLQYKTLYECPGCALKYNLVGASGGKQYRCKKCGTILTPQPSGSGVRADESVYGLNLEVGSDLPPEVAQAELDPSNVFGRYILVRPLGRGGSGTVHLAYQKELKRFVALKLLRGGDEETLQRFAHEAQLAARLKHPNIVSVYEIDKHHNVQFIALEYVDGRALDQRGRMPIRKACLILRDVANAIHYAHEKGIIHRDLKPQNILLDKEDRPYVSDFGLAREIASGTNLTVEGIVVGTPAYMSPEQAQGDRMLDRRTDVASLGAVLYELLTGAQPYAGNTQIDVALAVINTEPVRPRRLDPALPPALEAITLKAMAKRKADRYPTALALAEDLQRFLEGEPVLAQPPGRMTSTVRRLAKHKTATAAFAGAMAAVVVAVVTLMVVVKDSHVKADLLRAQSLEGAGRLHEALVLYESLPDSSAQVKRLKEAIQARELEQRRERDWKRAVSILDQAGPELPAPERIVIATQAIQVFPEFEQAFALRALAHQDLGEDGEAYDDLGRAAGVSPSPLPHHIGRAEIARRMGRLDDEIRDLTAGLELTPLSSDLRIYRSWAYARQARALARDTAGDARERAGRALSKAQADLAAVRKHSLLETVQAAIREATVALQ